MLSRKPRNGFAPLLIAMGIVAMLGAFGMSLQLTQMLSQKRKVARLDNIEGFYAGELTAWHARERVEASLSSEDSVQAAPALPDGAGESFDTSRGASISFEVTSRYAPANTFFRRISKNGLTWKVPTSTEPVCGKAELSNRSRRRLCLTKSNAPYEFLVFRSEPSSGFVATKQYLLAFDRNGRPITSFGNNGRVDLDDLQDIRASRLPKIPFLSDDRFYLARGVVEGSTRSVHVARYFDNGKLDTSYGSEGFIQAPHFSETNPYCWVVFPGGALVFCADTPEGGGISLVKYLENGERDSQFGENGTATLLSGQGVAMDNPLGAIYGDRAGRIYGVANTGTAGESRAATFRVNANGTIDTGFASNGLYTAADVSDAFIGTVDDRDGFTWVEHGPFGTRLRRHRSQGDFDPGFNGGNPLMLEDVRPFPSPTSRFFSNIFLHFPTSTAFSWVYRLREFNLSDGKYDRAFGENGEILLDDSEFISSGGWSSVGTPDLALDRHAGFMVIHDYNREITPGTWESLIRISRYDASGKVITGFGESGVLEFRRTGGHGLPGSETVTILFHPRS